MTAKVEGTKIVRQDGAQIGHLIYKCIVGSQLYGTNTPTSDVDHKGVFIQYVKSILVDGVIKQIDVTKDEVYYEVSRFLDLAQSANPTILELMFVPDDYIVYKTPEIDCILQNRFDFLTKKCRKSFGGYAIEQISKAKGLNKKMNWEKEKTVRKTPLDFCYVYVGGDSIPLKDYLSMEDIPLEYCGASKINNMRDMYVLYVDKAGHLSSIDGNPKKSKFKGIASDDSNELRLDDVSKEDQKSGYLTIFSYNKDGYTTHCKEYNQYLEWLENRNTERYVDVENTGDKIDGKNIMHCRRLLDVAMEIPVLKNIVCRRPNAEYLLDIRKGKNIDRQGIINQAQQDLEKMDELYEKCDLPDDLDPKFIRNILMQIRYDQIMDLVDNIR